jgi:anthranilate synthase component II
MKILILDNYDSFVYNLFHMIKKLGYSPDVVRNNTVSLSDVDHYDKYLLSPGPGLPAEAGIMPELISQLGSSRNIFGVCLGHQAIAEAYGASLYNLPGVLHGISTTVHLQNNTDSPFQSLPESFKVCHYHSWVVSGAYLPEVLQVTAINEDGWIMALRHKLYNVSGVQFHPESYISEFGYEMLSNWLSE